MRNGYAAFAQCMSRDHLSGLGDAFVRSQHLQQRVQQVRLEHGLDQISRDPSSLQRKPSPRWPPEVSMMVTRLDNRAIC